MNYVLTVTHTTSDYDETHIYGYVLGQHDLPLAMTRIANFIDQGGEHDTTSVLIRTTKNPPRHTFADVCRDHILL